jgi:hypothetical protein
MENLETLQLSGRSAMATHGGNGMSHPIVKMAIDLRILVEDRLASIQERCARPWLQGQETDARRLEHR